MNLAWTIATIHPAALLRAQKMQIAVIRDLKKLVRIQREGPSIVPICEPPRGLRYPTQTTHPDLDDVTRFLARYHRVRLSCDFEATFGGEIWCLGLWPVDTYLSDVGLCIPFRCRGGARFWSANDEAHVLDMLRGMLEDAAWLKVGQNWVGFDGGYSDHGWQETHWALTRRAWGIEPKGLDIDTMVAHWATFPELPHSLAFQASMDTDLPAYKEEVHQQESGTEDEPDDLVKFENLQDIEDMKLRVYCLRDCFAQAAAAVHLERVMA